MSIRPLRGKAYETALRFFGFLKVRFAGKDGTMYSNPLYDLTVFFIGAYVATGTPEVAAVHTNVKSYISEF